MREDELNLLILEEHKRHGRTARLLFLIGLPSLFILTLLIDCFLEKWGVLQPYTGEVRIASIASFLIFLVEDRMKESRLEQIQINVWHALLQTLVPPKIVDELTMIIKEPVYRKDLTYRLKFYPFPNNSGERLCRIRREVSYELVNNTDIDQPYAIQSWTQKHNKMPGNIELWVKNAKIDLPRVNSEEDEGAFETNESVKIRKNVIVPLRRTLRIQVEADEFVRLEQLNNSHIILGPTTNLYVTLENENYEEIETLSAELFHRKGRKFIPEHGKNYYFEGGILPGQSFQVHWTLKNKPHNAETLPADQAESVS